MNYTDAMEPRIKCRLCLVLVSAVLVWFVLLGAEQGDIYLFYGDSGLDEFNIKGAVLKQIRQKVPWVAGGSILGFTGSDEDWWLFPGLASAGVGRLTTKRVPPHH